MAKVTFAVEIARELRGGNKLKKTAIVHLAKEGFGTLTDYLGQQVGRRACLRDTFHRRQMKPVSRALDDVTCKNCLGQFRKKQAGNE